MFACNGKIGAILQQKPWNVWPSRRNTAHDHGIGQLENSPISLIMRWIVFESILKILRKTFLLEVNFITILHFVRLRYNLTGYSYYARTIIFHLIRSVKTTIVLIIMVIITTQDKLLKGSSVSLYLSHWMGESRDYPPPRWNNNFNNVTVLHDWTAIAPSFSRFCQVCIGMHKFDLEVLTGMNASIWAQGWQGRRVLVFASLWMGMAHLTSR